MNIAIIPARGGSKRIPYKNIKEFHGRPIIEYSIKSALNSKLFDRVVVTTDDPEIAKVAEAAGAEVPFLRESSVSGDYVGVLEVIQDCIVRLGIEDAVFTCIYATAPLLIPEDLCRGMTMLKNDDSNSFVIASTKYNYPVQRAYYLDENDKLKMLYPEHYSTRSQDLPSVYHDAAMFYMAKASVWLAAKRIYCDDAVIVEIPDNRYCDIDTLEDWTRAEYLFSVL
ncbi:pseudaminic acid cytidylyltransferase [Persicirhabdus sediminis]|uniref:Pseudaminic acid cytidylyltransferase n=1 Tax=Persicirhabdus sediminis TaxID=454144 RepID=A0A8J7MH76_9BACT|nr:pseudaminic acid cytidylyltransferase [Persicirhabdus sediminis]MBK1792773.1 pseudaminic acid cytidylyltransferase [Persicirhabdus sediminis]